MFEATNKITDMGGKFIAHYNPNLLIYLNDYDKLKLAEWYASNNS